MEEVTTVVCECSEYLPAVLDALEHIYALGLYTVALAGAGTVCLVLYGVLSKIFR